MSTSDKMTVVKFFADEDTTAREKLAIAKEFDQLTAEEQDQLAEGIRNGTLDY